LDLSEDDRRKRAQLDAQIDQLIYKIYGLNPDEIEHVEQSYPR